MQSEDFLCFQGNFFMRNEKRLENIEQKQTVFRNKKHRKTPENQKKSLKNTRKNDIEKNSKSRKVLKT